MAMLGFLIIPAVCVIIAISLRPALGAYLLLLASPLIVGIARGPVPLRPNEMLLLLVMAGLGARLILLMLSGTYRPPRFDRMDGALLLLVATGSVMPVVSCLLAGQPLSTDDLLYSFVLIKYYAVFRIFRSTILTVRQVMICLWISMASAAMAGAVAILQVGNLLGVPEFLLEHYDLPYDTPVLTVDRGTSTLASAFGLGDQMIMNLIIALVFLRLGKSHKTTWASAAFIFICGCMASGELSEYVGLAVATVAFASLFGSSVRPKLPLLLGASALAAIIFWPVIARRFAGFGGGEGFPTSWDMRWDNLQLFFIPKILEGANWLLGVQPAPRVAAPERWREFVYIESGYLWLVWIGGVPFLMAFAYFVFTAFGTLRQIARARFDAVAAAAAGGFCYLSALLVMTLFDPHLTLRGSADLFFPLLAMSLVRAPVAARKGMRQLPMSFVTGRRPVVRPTAVRGEVVATAD